MPRKKTARSPVDGDPQKSVFGILQGLVSLKELVGRSLEGSKRGLQRWLVRTIVLGLSVFVSLVFLVLGFFFIAIDQGGLPRGAVFACGGLLGLMALKLLVPSAK